MKILHLFFLLNITINAQIFVENNLEDVIDSMNNFINSEKFKELKKNNSDLALVDTIYLRVKMLQKNDIAETLLASTFITLPFRKMPLHIPFTKMTFDIKLPSGNPVILKKKIANLPKNIFPDSPKSKFGDKDKVAHFFGNAYFSYSVTFFNLSKFLSIFVELFEDTFEIQGSIDRRDLITNHLGFLFGKTLRKNPDALPSDALKKYGLIKNNFK
jgi:hypothetical protein